MLKKIVFCLAVLVLAGCASAPTQSQFESADFGVQPIEYEKTIKTYYESRLKDPFSAQYKFTHKPKKFYINDLKRNIFGWKVCATINAKNSYGGYIGWKTEMFMFRGEKIYLSPDLIVLPSEPCNANEESGIGFIEEMKAK